MGRCCHRHYRCTSVRILLLCVGAIWEYIEYETVVVRSRESESVVVKWHSCPGVQGARPGDFFGPPGQNAGNVGGSPPDRVEQLLDFVLPIGRLRIVPRKCVGMLIIPKWGR